ncbi:hypothetical protein ASG68_29170 [Rhizobium sp. Leaf453]|nr:hypothetical protein ASG42_29820 [Rhizobium sp. Leaf391]KQT04683.1 hypothetical protein ASG50_15540 [Rhizobium sp. Leaf386]KQU00959.1 hypothetical protein ASG68_29170 [Rhizobium sp. Leaf453]
MTGIEYIASDLLLRGTLKQRYLVAVAGPPGAGKSTFSQALCAALPMGDAAVFQMGCLAFAKSKRIARNVRSCGL